MVLLIMVAAMVEH
jgi:ABC-type amino acid transport system permease subunit